MPMIAELASMFEADSQIERLTQHFGGEERWREIARQIDAWGRSRLPSRVFEALSTTFEGVVAMHRMMSGDEPGLLREGQGSDGSPTEASLKQNARSPLLATAGPRDRRTSQGRLPPSLSTTWVSAGPTPPERLPSCRPTAPPNSRVVAGRQVSAVQPKRRSAAELRFLSG
jgi:hypothetical protein